MQNDEQVRLIKGVKMELNKKVVRHKWQAVVLIPLSKATANTRLAQLTDAMKH